MFSARRGDFAIILAAGNRWNAAEAEEGVAVARYADDATTTQIFCRQLSSAYRLPAATHLHGEANNAASRAFLVDPCNLAHHSLFLLLLL